MHLLVILPLYLSLILVKVKASPDLKYIWGDAVHDKEILGPDGQPYPWDVVSKIAKTQSRIPRGIGDELSSTSTLLSPEEIRALLLRVFDNQLGLGPLPYQNQNERQGRSSEETGTNSKNNHEGCVPSRLCETTYNTTAPMYGISLTSGKPVTIVQKFPDLLQQVVYQVCKSEECDLIQGKCVQTYLPYLFLVIPLGPVTLTGQDYVLIESGCACKPKYSKKSEDQPQLTFLQSFQNVNVTNHNVKPRTNKRF